MIIAFFFVVVVFLYFSKVGEREVGDGEDGQCLQLPMFGLFETIYINFLTPLGQTEITNRF